MIHDGGRAGLFLFYLPSCRSFPLFNRLQTEHLNEESVNSFLFHPFRCPGLHNPELPPDFVLLPNNSRVDVSTVLYSVPPHVAEVPFRVENALLPLV